MFTIWKRFDFSASHRLNGLPESHPCSRLHGHNYQVEIELRANEVDAVGFVLDYRAMDKFKAFIDTELDHRDLNNELARMTDGDTKMNPTAENLAAWLYAVARGMFEKRPIPFTTPQVWVSAVRVRETEKTCAEFKPS